MGKDEKVMVNGEQFEDIDSFVYLVTTSGGAGDDII